MVSLLPCFAEVAASRARHRSAATWDGSLVVVAAGAAFVTQCQSKVITK